MFEKGYDGNKKVQAALLDNVTKDGIATYRLRSSTSTWDGMFMSYLQKWGLFNFSYKGIKPLEMERLDQFNMGFKSIKIGTSWDKTFLYKVWDRT